MIYELKQLFNDTYWGEMDLLTKFSNKFRYIKKDKHWHYCYNYVFNKEYTKDVNKIMENIINYYFPIKFKDIKRRDIILFSDKRNIIKHSAKVWKKGKLIGETIVRAKFGQWSIYEYKLKNSLKTYGSIISFWRKRR